MIKPKTKSAQAKQKPSAGRGRIKHALIKQSKLRKRVPKGSADPSSSPNPFGIRVIGETTFLTEEAVDHQFKEIRRVFFPGFDRKEEWSVVNGYSKHAIARTVHASRVIVYTDKLLEQPILVLNVILIHELCHAALPQSLADHGKRWRRRMIEAADTAQRIRDWHLVVALAGEALRYDRGSPFYVPPVNARTCYDKITQLVTEEPDWSFEDVMDEVSFSLFVPRFDLICDFSKCYEVYEKARKRVYQQKSF